MMPHGLAMYAGRAQPPRPDPVKITFVKVCSFHNDEPVTALGSRFPVLAARCLTPRAGFCRRCRDRRVFYRHQLEGQ